VKVLALLALLMVLAVGVATFGASASPASSCSTYWVVPTGSDFSVLEPSYKDAVKFARHYGFPVDSIYAEQVCQ
jgi:hypothetical protein